MPSQPTGRLGFSSITGLAAIGFAVTIILVNVILVPAGLPLTGAGIGQAEAFFTTEGGVVAAASALTPTAWLLATVFGAGAVSALRRSERDRGEAWSLIGFTGLALQNATFAAVTATRLAMSSAATDGNPATSGLWPLHDALFTLNGTFLALALIGLSIAGLRAGLIRPWHGAIGLTSAVLLFTSATLTPLIIDHESPLGLLGLVGWLLWVGWILAYGTTLIRLSRSPSVVGRNP